MASLGMKIIVYYKTGCPWAGEVMEFLDQHHLSFEERNISINDDFRREMEEKSGQSQSPTVDIDGKLLPDTDVETLAEFLEDRGVGV